MPFGGRRPGVLSRFPRRGIVADVNERKSSRRHRHRFQEPRMNRQPALPGIAAKLLALVVGGALLVLGALFSVALFAIVAFLGLVAGGYVWWKTRALRQAMRQRRPEGQVIDGEAVVVEERFVHEEKVLPEEPPRD
jgi:hypothetical protein